MDTPQPDLVIAEDLLPGDLLFQLRMGGEQEPIISRLFAGRDGMAVNHVAIYEGDGMAIEAVTSEVKKTSLDEFFSAAVHDNHGRPCVFVCRVEAAYSSVVAAALEFAQQQVSTHDNSHSRDVSRNHQKSWYCGELIVQSFRHSKESLFKEESMTFHKTDTGELLPFWVQHCQSVGQETVERFSHPALLSCSDKLAVVNVFGSLPARNSQNLCALKPGSTLA